MDNEIQDEIVNNQEEEKIEDKPQTTSIDELINKVAELQQNINIMQSRIDELITMNNKLCSRIQNTEQDKTTTLQDVINSFKE